MRKLIAGTIALGFGLAAPLAASAQETTLTLATLALPGSPYKAVIESLPERVSEATDGKVQIRVTDTLIPGNELASAVRDGRVAMSGGINAYLSSEAPRLTIGNLPGLVNNVIEHKFLLDTWWRDATEEVWRSKYNAVPLMSGAFGPQVVLSKKPIRSVEDFEGLKMRVHNTQTAALMEALGAKPTPVSGSETLIAMERGVVDAVLQSLVGTYDMGFPDVAEHVQMWPIASIQPWTVIANADQWDALPADQREIIETVMRDAENEHYAGYNALVQEYFDKWRAKGIEIWVPDEAAIEALNAEKYIKPVYEAWYEQAEKLGFDGRAFVAQARKVLGK